MTIGIPNFSTGVPSGTPKVYKVTPTAPHDRVAQNSQNLDPKMSLATNDDCFSVTCDEVTFEEFIKIAVQLISQIKTFDVYFL